MSIQEYRSKRNRTWENQSLTLQEFAAKLNPYLGGTYKNIGNSGAATTIDWSAAKVQELNLNNSPALTFANGIEGSELTLLLASDTTQRSVIWPSDVTWSQNIAPTIAPAQLGGTFVLKAPSGNMGTGFNNTPQFVKTLSTGKILVSGVFNSYSGTFCSQLVRLNADLTLDTSFAQLSWGTPNNTPILDAVELPNGNIVVVGGFGNYGNPGTYGNPCLQLLSPDGFRIPTPALFPDMNITLYTIGMQSNGKFIVGGGYFSGPNTSTNVVRIDQNLSTYDNSFFVNINDVVFSLVVKSDDSIYVGGNFSTLDGGLTFLPNRGLGALSPDGQPLTYYFEPVFSPGMGQVRKLLLTDTEKVYVGGSFSPSGFAPSSFMRFTNNGAWDTTFMGSGASGTIYTMAICEDGTIAVGGQFSTYNFQNVANFAFVNPDGTLNLNFLPTTNAFSGQVLSIDNAVSNNLIIVGSFNNYNSTYAPTIALLTGIVQDAAYTKVDFQYNGDKYIGSF